ncbi:sensor histidine kinase [Vibrio harveyi]|uniref:ATP-binding protein n=2 Tax=Vibrio harveyi group TaxID=717610 RepID=UPI0038CD2DB0
MSQLVPFVTRARALDHLGREQIADCPTAISELWKNSFDAYASDVTLHIMDGHEVVAAITDNGHGMSAEDFIGKWLVIGTESKKAPSNSDIEDRNGLSLRAKQGQKGIGRLSCAIMGSLLLIVSKKKNNRFVASLIDWRLFENPFLYLHDIHIPVEEFDNAVELQGLLPSMQEDLKSNLLPIKLDDDARNRRITESWKMYTDFERSEYKEEFLKNNSSVKDEEIFKNFQSSCDAILSTINRTTFNESNFSKWDLFAGIGSHGTALFIGNVNEDIKAQLINNTVDHSVNNARQKFMSTLSNFSENLVGKDRDLFETLNKIKDEEYNSRNNDFNHRVITWIDNSPKVIISSEIEFSSSEFDRCEHLLSGYVDTDGIFHGRMKSFGVDRGDIKIEPNISVSKHARSKVGAFHITVASFESTLKNTTLTDDEHAYIFKEANNSSVSGFLVYRDSLRVMPYGRDDNDFFEIDARRSKNAGMYHYSNRNIFGRVILTSDQNKNLRDKAGREGFIDNKASKEFRELVINILKVASNRYIGRNSEVRKEILPRLHDIYNKKQADEEREKKKKLDKTNFVKKLMTNTPLLKKLDERFVAWLNDYSKNKDSYSYEQLEYCISEIFEFKDQLSKLRFKTVPRNIGNVETQYRSFRESFSYLSSQINLAQTAVGQAQEDLKPKSNSELLLDRSLLLRKNHTRRLNENYKFIEKIFSEELNRLKNINEKKSEQLKTDFDLILNEVKFDQISLQQAFSSLDISLDKSLLEGDSVYSSYSLALEHLQNDIDLALIASFDTDELIELESEINRLNALAQLGVTVEIIGHELGHLDGAVTQSLTKLMKVKDESLRSLITNLNDSYKGISNKFNFLSPLRLSGARKKENISGSEIKKYIEDFFSTLMLENKIDLTFTEKFENISIYEEKSRVLPVFVNLINNSRYWVCQKRQEEKKILIDVVGSDIYVSDNGPGVDKDDIKNLFKIFFSRKASGGRGVGLYLCKTSMTAGGHKINYVSEPGEMLLSGANFALSFKGLKNG